MASQLMCSSYATAKVLVDHACSELIMGCDVHGPSIKALNITLCLGVCVCLVKVCVCSGNRKIRLE
jgi:hypothetical protein